jgi:putative amino-acid transport system permease protein
MGFQIDFFLKTLLEVLPYVKYTILIALASFVFSSIIALFMSVILILDISKSFNRFFKLYTSFFRSTPLMTQLFFFYFGLPQIFPGLTKLSSMIVLIIVMSLNEAAFMAEIIRGAFLSIPKGQYDAAKSIGMTTRELMQIIIIPQVIRVALPGLVNCTICLIKGSAIGFTVGVMDVMTAAKIITGRSYRVMEVYAAVLIIYWLIVIIMTRFQSRLESRLNRGYA